MDKKDFVVQRGWLFETKQDFARRFNIDILDSHFYERCITMISNIIGNRAENQASFEKLCYEVYSIIGEIYTQKYCYTKSMFPKFDNTETYEFNFSNTNLYSTLNRLSREKTLPQFLGVMECILNFAKTEKDENILLHFNDIACLSNKNVRLCYDDKYRFYPCGVEIFDEKLINDILEFLQPYAKAHKELSEALQEFLNKSYRDAVDKTRLALEIFLRELLNNKKTLENQKEELNQYLGNDVHQNIKSMFLQILDFYTKFNNNEAKHNSGNFSECEVEFLFYLVGNFIRLFMQIEKERNLS